MVDLIDFDREYMRFAARVKPDLVNLKDEALEDALNEITLQWLSQPHESLGGATPDGYFAAFSARELIDLMIKYARAGMNIPEPLYRRLSEFRDCAQPLARVAEDKSAPEAARATALQIICDENHAAAADICVDMLAETGALNDIAAAWLARAGYWVVDKLLARYADSPLDVIIDLLCYYPGVEKTVALLADRLIGEPEKYAFHASLAERLGDPELIEPLQYIAQSPNIGYYDYKAVTDAIESLGGDPGARRDFFGDPDFEALRREIAPPTDFGGSYT